MTLSVALTHRLGEFSLDVAFEAPAGVTALFGRSGAGKTSIVNAVAGLLRPDTGRISADGETLLDTESGVDLPPSRRRIGYVFQEARLFPHMTVRQNLLYGRWFQRGSSHLGEVADLLGVGDLLDRRPDGLSGGERQRIAIGRALLSDPRLLLMDEPLASLDAARKAEIIPYLERLAHETRLPILYVSHSISEVARLASTMVVIEKGRVACSGPTADVLSDPDAVPLMGVREAGAVLTARVARHHDDGLTELSISAGSLFLPRIAAPMGAAIKVRIEAHDIMLSSTVPEGLSALNVLPVTVTAVRPGAGPGAAVGLAAGEDRLLARVTRRSVDALGLKPGVACYAILKSTSIAGVDVGGV